MMAIPKAFLEGLGLTPNAKVTLSLDHGRLVVEPCAKPKYTLAELLAQCDAQAEPHAEEKAWQDSGPTGREVI
jgi:antitoxin ChpS